MTLFELREVAFRYPSTGAVGVDAITTSFREGELVSILGPNGSGKSSLLKLLARVHVPDRGTVLFEGTPTSRWNGRAYARKIGYLPQSAQQAFPMRALDLVLSGRAPFLGRFEWESGEDGRMALDALRQCDAAHLADRFVDEMSGGERRRVELARVLAGSPRAILLDEPLTALDAAHAQQFLDLLRRIAGEGGRTVLFVSHDLNWSAAVSDRMMVMGGGRIVADDVPARIVDGEVIRRCFGWEAEIVESGGRRWALPRAGGGA